MEDSLKPGHGEEATGEEPRDQLPQYGQEEEKSSKEEDGTRTDQWGFYCNEVTHPEMHWLRTEQRSKLFQEWGRMMDKAQVMRSSGCSGWEGFVF